MPEPKTSKLKCPRTGKPMLEVEIAGVTVDVSPGCGGVWFDNQEFKKFDEPHEPAGQELLHVIGAYAKPVSDPEKRLRCPKGCDAVMMRRFSSQSRGVTIDECPGCGGIWLDPGELAAIHQLDPADKTRTAARKTLEDELAGSVLFRGKESEKSRRRFSHAFGWFR